MTLQWSINKRIEKTHTQWLVQWPIDKPMTSPGQTDTKNTSDDLYNEQSETRLIKTQISRLVKQSVTRVNSILQELSN
jgi:hypothetical protein